MPTPAELVDLLDPSSQPPETLEPRPPSTNPAQDAVAQLEAAQGHPGWGNERVPIGQRLQHFLQTHAQANNPWEQVQEGLRQHFPGVEAPGLERGYNNERDLAVARLNVRDSEETGQSWRARHVYPFASAAVNVDRAVRVGRARQRLEAGNPEPDDFRLIAEGERLQQLDEARSHQYGSGITDALAGIPALVGEAVVGGRLLTGAASGIGRLAGRAAPAAAETAAVPWSVGGTLRATPGVVGRAAAVSPLMPSMYGEQAVRNNVEAGRDPTDPRGLPPALALATLQNSVLGSLGRVANNVPGREVGDYLRRLATRVPVGMGEQAAIDVIAGSVGMQTGYGLVGDVLRGVRTGDFTDAFRHATVQAVTFAAFSTLHEVQHPARNRPIDAFLEASRTLNRAGLSEGRAGEMLSRVQQMHANELAAAEREGRPPQNLFEGWPEGNARERALRGYGQALFEGAAVSPRETAPPGPERPPEQPQAAPESPQKAAPAPEREQAPVPPPAPRVEAPMTPEQAAGALAQEQARQQAEGRNAQRRLGHAPLPPAEQVVALEQAHQRTLARAADARRAEHLARQDLMAAGLGEGSQGRRNEAQARLDEAQGTVRESERDAGRLERRLDAARVEVAQGRRQEQEALAQVQQPMQQQSLSGLRPRPPEPPQPPPAAPEAPPTPPAPPAAPEPPPQPQVAPAAPQVAPATAGEPARLSTPRGRAASLEAASLSASERRSLEAMLEGTPLREAAGQVGMSHEGLRKAGERALRRLREADPENWGEFRSVQDVIDVAGLQRAQERLEQSYAGEGGERVLRTTLAELSSNNSSDVRRAVGASQRLEQRREAVLDALADRWQREQERGTLTPEREADYERRVSGVSEGGEGAVRREEGLLGLRRGRLGAREPAPVRREGAELPARPEAPPVPPPGEGEPAGPGAQAREGPGAAPGEPAPNVEAPAPAAAGRGEAPGNVLTPPEVAVPPQTLSLLTDVVSSGNRYMLEKVRKAMGEFFSDRQVRQALHAADYMRHPDRGAAYRDERGSQGRPPNALQRGYRAQDAEHLLMNDLRAELTRHLDPEGVADANRQLRAAGEKPLAPEDYSEAGEIARREAARPEGETPGDAFEPYGALPGEFEFGFNAPEPAEPARPAEPGRSLTDRIAEAARGLVEGESGTLHFPHPQVDVGKVKDALTRGVHAVQDNLAELGGASFPRTARVSEEASNALARNVAARGFAREATPNMIDAVEGPRATPEQDRLWGATFTEMHLRYTRFSYLQQSAEYSREAAAMRQAGNQAGAAAAARDATEAQTRAREVRSLVGDPAYPELPTLDRYQQTRESPEFKQLLERWRERMVPVMEDNYRRAMGLEDSDPIRSRTQIPGLPMNLKPLGNEATAATAGQSQGNLLGQRQGSLRFANQRRGNASGYDVSLGAIIENSLAHGITRAAKAEMFRELHAGGVGVWGEPYQQVEGRRGIPEINPRKGTQEAEAGQTWMYVLDNAYNEVRQSLQLDQPAPHIPGATLLMRAALASSIDAVTHVKNQLTSLWESGMMNLASMWKNAAGLFTRNPEVMAQAVELARIQAWKGGEAQGVLWGGPTDPTKWLGRVIEFTGKVLRLQANDAYSEQVRRGLTADTEAGRRNFVNRLLGNYDKPAQNAFVRLLRDTGVGPFATAGTTYYMQGLRSLTARTAYTPTSLQADLQLRAWKLAKVASVVGVSVLANVLLHGRWDGSDETPLGAVHLGTTRDGRPVDMDLTNLTGLTRGARETGVLAVAEGVRHQRTPAQIADRAVTNMLDALVHPAMGPAPAFAHTLATGRNSIGMPLTGRHEPGASQAWSNALAAFANVNPALATTFGWDRPRDELSGLRFTRMAGPFAPRIGSDAVSQVNSRLHDLGEQRTEHNRGPLLQGRAFPREREYQVLHQFQTAIQQLDRAIAGRARVGHEVRQGQVPDDEAVRQLRERRTELARRALQLLR